VVDHVRKARRGRGGRPGPPVYDDRVQRVFTAEAPDAGWLTEITEHRTAWFPAGEGKLSTPSTATC
jgi:putative transposase